MKGKSVYDDLEKEFSYMGIVLTRYDYESMPCPMAATLLDDETMQKIAKDTFECMISDGWSKDEIAKYAWDVDNFDSDCPSRSVADAIRADFWRCMEKAAIENGMRYYEDMEEG